MTNNQTPYTQALQIAADIETDIREAIQLAQNIKRGIITPRAYTTEHMIKMINTLIHTLER